MTPEARGKRKTKEAAVLLPNKRHEEQRDGTIVADCLIEKLRAMSHYTVGDQVPPCAILWPDEGRLWETVIEELQRDVPELFVHGPFDPPKKTGPAIWLKCVEAGVIEPPIPDDRIPIFYLPGIGRQQLREVEDLPFVLQPLAELQFRGVVWAHPNGRDWTPLGFLSSDRGGLGFEIVRDEKTQEALQRALSLVLRQPLAELASERLDGEFFDRLLNPDLPSQVLRWMNDSERFRKEKDPNQWKAFCDQCVGEYHIHPEKDGPLKAAELLGDRVQKWADVWRRFTEAPGRYAGVISLLEKADPGDRGQFPLFEEGWPRINDQKELELAATLTALKDRSASEVAQRVLDLSKEHSVRRQTLWAELGRAQLALALKHLEILALSYDRAIGGATAEDVAETYVSDGWRIDAAVVGALACCKRVEHEAPIICIVRTLYLHWLEHSARHLQLLTKAKPASIHPRLGSVEASAGKVIVFADGLRIDIAERVKANMQGHEVELTWDWAPFPPVTPTAKPHVSPVSKAFVGRDTDEEFAVSIESTGHKMTNDRFEALLTDQGIQVLENHETGDPAGSAWTEIGKVDSHGHDEGWKLVERLEQEVTLLADRAKTLLAAGWKEVSVVTDHGFLIMPGGLPKIELPKYLVVDRWGRCATLRETTITDLPQVPWFWNNSVAVVSPPGVGCFKAGVEYVHGGISVQELIVPRLMIRASTAMSEPRISLVKWVGLRCRVTVSDPAEGIKVDVRTRPAAQDTSRVEGHEAREISADGTVSLPIADSSDEGMAAVVVVLSSDGRVLHSVPTEIGVNK